jgi:hypothetical protein
LADTHGTIFSVIEKSGYAPFLDPNIYRSYFSLSWWS